MVETPGHGVFPGWPICLQVGKITGPVVVIGNSDKGIEMVGERYGARFVEWCASVR